MEIHIEVQEMPVSKPEVCYECGADMLKSMYQTFLFVDNEVIPTIFIYCEKCYQDDDRRET